MPLSNGWTTTGARCSSAASAAAQAGRWPAGCNTESAALRGSRETMMRSWIPALFVACFFSCAHSSAATPPAVQGEPVVQETPEQLQQLVAPIALYPDALVAQILAASTYPTEIVEADRWVQQHSD